MNGRRHWKYLRKDICKTEINTIVRNHWMLASLVLLLMRET